jgi:hypothetical protein
MSILSRAFTGRSVALKGACTARQDGMAALTDLVKEIHHASER